MSFPIDTGLGAENIAPRALARLSDDPFVSLIQIFHTVEEIGEWPEASNPVMIVVLPKTDGGTRPIGISVTSIRVWMGARSRHAGRWEADHEIKSVYGGAGMGAQRAAGRCLQCRECGTQ